MSSVTEDADRLRAIANRLFLEASAPLAGVGVAFDEAQAGANDVVNASSAVGMQLAEMAGLAQEAIDQIQHMVTGYASTLNVLAAQLERGL